MCREKPLCRYQNILEILLIPKVLCAHCEWVSRCVIGDSDARIWAGVSSNIGEGPCGGRTEPEPFREDEEFNTRGKQFRFTGTKEMQI